MKDLEGLDLSELQHQTWQEFIDSCCFDMWAMTGSGEEEYLVNHCYTGDILDDVNCQYDMDRKVVDWGVPVVIDDFEKYVEFWIVYIWNEKTLEYNAWGDAFWSEEEAQAWIKERKKGK